MDDSPSMFTVKAVKWLTILSFFFACGPAGAGVDSQDNWWSRTAQQYAGTTLRGVTEDTPASRYVAQVLAPAFERETGIRVALEWIPWEEMYDRSIRDMARGSGLYDFVFVEQDIVSAYLAHDYLVNLSKLLKDHPDLASPDFSFDDFTSYLDYFRVPGSGDVFGVPIESFLKVYMYRRDLFDDPLVQRAFRDRFAYELEPAKTLEQFRDISVFFTDWGKQNGLNLWGTTIQGSPQHPASFLELVETIFPSFGVYDWGINRETWAASTAKGGALNSQKAKQAFGFWLEMLQFSPPESYGSTWTETSLSFASGRIAHGWIYGENVIWQATDAEQSAITGTVGTGLPPLAPGVLDDAKSGKGYIGYYDGGAFAMPHSSRNKDASLLWLQYIGQPSVQVDWAMATGRMVHSATLNDRRVRAMDERIGGYYSLVRDYGELFAGSPPFVEHAAIRELVSPFVYRAIRGELSPSDALDSAAEAVDALLATLH